MDLSCIKNVDVAGGLVVPQREDPRGSTALVEGNGGIKISKVACDLASKHGGFHWIQLMESEVKDCTRWCPPVIS